jgi:Family of unknown function (DUF5898)
LFQNAEKEAENWKKLYKNLFNFVHAVKVGDFSILVLPYLRVPKTKQEREDLMLTRQDSPLWKGLTAFATKGYVHDDLKWDHIGVVWECPESTVIFLDLVDLSKVSTKSEADEWMRSSFALLEKCA